MSNDLVAVLGARLDQFAADLNQAGDMADTAVSRIEASFANMNPNFGGLATLGLSAAGAVAGVVGLMTALKGVNAELAQIAQLAQYLDTTTDNVQKLQYAGMLQGVSGSQSLQDLQNVGRLLADANENENSLTKLLAANNVAYKDRAGDLISINQLLGKGADLVKNAGSYADKVEIAKMLGLTQQWVPALQQGAAGFQKIADSATDAGAVIDKETIAKAAVFDAAWKRSSAQLSAQFKAATADVASYLDDLIAKAENFLADFNKANGIGEGSGQAKFNSTADMLELVARDAAGAAQNLEQVNRVLDYLYAKNGDPDIIRGIEEIRAKAQAAADAMRQAAEEQSRAAFPGGVPLPAARPAAADDIDDPTRLPKRKTDASDAFDRAQNQIIRQTEVLKAETQAVGENTQTKTEAKAIAELQTAAQRAGITLTEEQKQKILDLAAAEGVAAQALADRNQKQQQNNELLQASGSEAISILDGLRTKSLTAEQAVAQLSNTLYTALERAVLLGQGPLAGLLGTAAQAGTGGTGGLFGSLFGIKGDADASPGTRAAPLPGLTADDYAIDAFAGGTDSAPGGLSLIGEDGPELMNVPRGAQIIPNDVLRQRSGGDLTVNLVEDSSRAGQTSKRDDGNGGVDLTMFVDAITARNALNPASSTSFALGQRGRVATR